MVSLRRAAVDRLDVAIPPVDRPTGDAPCQSRAGGEIKRVCTPLFDFSHRAGDADLRGGQGVGELGGVAVRIGGRGGNRFPGDSRLRQHHVEAGVAAGICGHDCGAQVSLAFPIAGGICEFTGVEVQRELGIGHAVEGSDRPGLDARLHRRQGGEVLQVVGPRVRVARVIGRNPIVAQIDPQAAVGEDGVASNAVSGRRIQHRHPGTEIEGDLIGQDPRTTDLVRVGVVENVHAAGNVPEGG